MSTSPDTQTHPTPTARQTTPLSPPAARRPRPAYPSDLTRSARRREQLQALRTGRQAEAQEVALRLETLGKEFPDYADILNSLALRVRTRGNSSPDRDADRIMRAVVMHQAQTVSEIVTDTGLLRIDVARILLGFVANGQLREEKRNGYSEYWPTGKPCGDVLP